MATAYDRAPDLDSAHHNHPASAPATAVLSEEYGEAASLVSEPARDQYERLGHTAARSLDEFAAENELPLLGRHGLFPGDHRTQPLLRGIGEVSINGHKAHADEPRQTLPDLNATPLMPEPPLAAWAQQRREQLWRLEEERLAMHPLTPWERQAYDRRKAWGEIGQSLRGLNPFRSRPRGEATFGMAGDSALYLLETHSARLGRSLANFPYAFSDWGDRQLTRFEDACDGLFDMVGSGARHVGNLMQKTGVARGWEWFNHHVADPLATNALYVTVMGGALTISFARSIPYYIGSIRHLPNYVRSRMSGTRHHAVDTDSGIQTAARPNQAMPSEAAPLSESDQELAALLEKAHRHQQIASRRVDLPADHALRRPDPELTDRLWALAAARFGKTGVVTSEEFWRIWDATHAVMEEAMLQGQMAVRGNPAAAREIYSALRGMYPEVDAAITRSRLSAEAAVADVLHDLGIDSTDKIGRLNVFTVMAAYFREITVDENSQPGSNSQAEPANQTQVSAPASTVSASQQTPPRPVVAPTPSTPGIEGRLIQILAGIQQPAEDLPDAQRRAALWEAVTIREALVKAGFSQTLEQIDQATGVTVTAAIAAILSSEGLIQKVDGDDGGTTYTGVYDARTVEAIAGALQAYHHVRFARDKGAS